MLPMSSTHHNFQQNPSNMSQISDCLIAGIFSSSFISTYNRGQYYKDTMNVIALALAFLCLAHCLHLSQRLAQFRHLQSQAERQADDKLINKHKETSYEDYKRANFIVVKNNFPGEMKLNDSYCDSGQLRSEGSRTIKPGQSQTWIFTKTSGTATGSNGAMIWTLPNVYGIKDDYKLYLIYQNPWNSYNFAGACIYKNPTPVTSPAKAFYYYAYSRSSQKNCLYIDNTQKKSTNFYQDQQNKLFEYKMTLKVAYKKVSSGFFSSTYNQVILIKLQKNYDDFQQTFKKLQQSSVEGLNCYKNGQQIDRLNFQNLLNDTITLQKFQANFWRGPWIGFKLQPYQIQTVIEARKFNEYSIFAWNLPKLRKQAKQPRLEILYITFARGYFQPTTNAYAVNQFLTGIICIVLDPKQTYISLQVLEKRLTTTQCLTVSDTKIYQYYQGKIISTEGEFKNGGFRVKANINQKSFSVCKAKDLNVLISYG